MKKSIDEFADLYDEWAAEYDDENDFDVRWEIESKVIEHAAPGPEDKVLDLGTGTGAVALALAESADRVIGRDISEGMLERAREKANQRGIENVEFGIGRFRDPAVSDADVVVTNLALHHLGTPEKRDAIETIGELDPRRVVFGEAMYFGSTDPDDPLFSPDSVYPSTVGAMVDAITDVGLAVTTVEKVHEEAGVIVGDRIEIT